MQDKMKAWKVEETVKTIAENLGKRGDVQETWERITLSKGLPGICVLLGTMMERYPKETRWGDLANRCLGKCVEHLNTHGLPGISLFSGLSGVGLGAVCASEGLTNYRNLVGTINRQITTGVEGYTEALKKGGGTHCLLYDAIEGLSGILNYLEIFKEDDLCREALEKGVNALVSLTGDILVQGYRVPGWYLPAENQFSRLEQEIYPAGNFNTSLSHGVAGPLIVLSKFYSAGIRMEGQRDAIEAIVDFYRRCRSSDGRRDFWKGQIDFYELAEEKITEKNAVRRDAWCYGAPGICYALIRAGIALENRELTEYAVENLRRAMQDIRGIFSPTFCHGYAGIYQVLQSAEDCLERELFGAEKRKIRQIILDFYESGYEFGFYNREFDREMGDWKEEETPGLLDGAAGVCLVLLENNNSCGNLWKRAFLLD